MKNTFLNDVIAGLSKTPKALPSKYFYDTKGSKLFQLIMKLPEYYLTKSEYEILETQSEQIYLDFNPQHTFDIVEFGAGDGSKTKLFLRNLLTHTNDFRYLPVDISQSVLDDLSSHYAEELPEFNLHPINDEYFSALDGIKDNKSTKLILFMGSNIGNFKDDRDIEFLKAIRDNVKKGDHLLIGFDLQKAPQIILDAYNDKQGVTKEFNINLLRRINEELDANFDIPSFDHYPTYNPETGEARSYLISMKQQTVQIADKSFDFDYAEPIYMEVSKKYTLNKINSLANITGFELVKNYYDCRKYFLDSLWIAT